MSIFTTQVSWQAKTDDSATEEFLSALVAANHRILAIERLVDGPDTTIRIDIASSQAPLPNTLLKLIVDPTERPANLAVEPSPVSRDTGSVVVIDVDSTLIQDEVVDVLADLAGQGPAVAALTEQAMCGELDFGEALTKRVALLAGLPETVLAEATEMITLQPGANRLVETLLARNAYVGLVSGGFSQVVDALARRLSVPHAIANTLEVSNGLLTGRVTGPLIDRAGKATALQKLVNQSGLSLRDSFAIGDGANDLDMINLASLGVAFNSKPALRAAANAVVDSPYLSDCLFVMGFVPLRGT